ncbi:DUF7167 family protein [Paenibacillus brasilensis]|uniref:DUF7167 domain-containing protein n=2 Tax=Paenibacillus brasilensis TaxID=128574 RepID=A0ABU0L7Q8_9BACL|nr:hypothetical protein [Paenibacillus brasilensis]MDQ0497313.1 hypothetical protein [Paenibacillus brasilensis]
MLIEWKMSIGYPTACREGEIEIDDEDFEGKTREEIRALIDAEIWEDAAQHVDAYPTNMDEIEEAIKKLTGGGKGE